MSESRRPFTSTRAFIDFATKLSAKWRLNTTPTKPLPPVPANNYEGMDAILRQLISYPTITGNTEAIHDAFEYIRTYLQQRGMHAKMYEHAGVESLVATTRHTKTPKVMLAAHLDVVAGPEHMFNLRLSEGRLYGRGTLDMKCSIATFMQVVDAISKNIQSYDLGIMISSDEEVGGDAGIGYLVDQGYVPSVCVLPDGGDNWQIQTFAKGFLFLSLVAKGKSAHGSRPWEGKNAIDMLIAALNDIKALFPKLTPKTDTINVGKIAGGHTINQVAGHAEVLIDIRVISEAHKADLLQKIKQICAKHTVDLTLVTQGMTVSLDLKDPYLASFANIIQGVTGQVITGSATLGTNDARFLIAKDIPCISYYPIGGGHHSPDEWLDQQAFHQSFDILSQFVNTHAH